MATATTSAPTEAEIREIVERVLADDGHALGLLGDAFGAAVYPLVDDFYDGEDLRPSEDADIGRLLGQGLDQVRDRAFQELREAAIKAVITFAAEHPAAPRAKEAVTV